MHLCYEGLIKRFADSDPILKFSIRTAARTRPGHGPERRNTSRDVDDDDFPRTLDVLSHLVFHGVLLFKLHLPRMESY